MSALGREGRVRLCLVTLYLFLAASYLFASMSKFWQSKVAEDRHREPPPEEYGGDRKGERVAPARRHWGQLRKFFSSFFGVALR